MSDPDIKPGSDPKKKHWLPLWFRIAVPILLLLVILKLYDLQVVVEIDYEEKAFVAALTDIETYYLPLALLLAYFLLAAICKWLFRKR
ncbi:MAG: hypothetical protein AAF353_02845 [Pseudomonadota bacterium]